MVLVANNLNHIFTFSPFIVFAQTALTHSRLIFISKKNFMKIKKREQMKWLTRFKLRNKDFKK